MAVSWLPIRVVGIAASDERWYGFDTLAEARNSEVELASIWRTTSHTWAAKNPKDTLWLPPVCNECWPLMCLDEACYAIGENPHERCDIAVLGNDCNRGSMPYRKID